MKGIYKIDLSYKTLRLGRVNYRNRFGLGLGGRGIKFLSNTVSVRLLILLYIKYYRVANYCKGVATDYREAIKELGQSCKEKPTKAVIVGSAFLAIW